MNPLNKITTFFKEVGLEMKKVNWPTRKDTLMNTITIILISVVAALFLGGLDYALVTYIMPWIISR
jgi:preprotein translocase subunit SecE